MNYCGSLWLRKLSRLRDQRDNVTLFSVCRSCNFSLVTNSVFSFSCRYVERVARLASGCCKWLSFGGILLHLEANRVLKVSVCWCFCEVCPSPCLLACMSLDLPVCQSIFRFIYICLSCLSTYLLIYLSVICLSICLTINLAKFFFRYVYLSICPFPSTRHQFQPESALVTSSRFIRAHYFLPFGNASELGEQSTWPLGGTGGVSPGPHGTVAESATPRCATPALAA